MTVIDSYWWLTSFLFYFFAESHILFFVWISLHFRQFPRGSMVPIGGILVSKMAKHYMWVKEKICHICFMWTLFTFALDPRTSISKHLLGLPKNYDQTVVTLIKCNISTCHNRWSLLCDLDLCKSLSLQCLDSCWSCWRLICSLFCFIFQNFRREGSKRSTGLSVRLSDTQWNVA